MLTCNRLWALGLPYLLVYHTYSYYTHTCTTHFASYIKTLMYILLRVKYNTIHLVFLTWYQSHCSKLFLCLAVWSLLVFFTASTSPVSKLFVFLLTASPLSEVLKVESPLLEALFVAAKDHYLLRSVHCDLLLWHQKYHSVDPKLIYSTLPELAPSDHSHAITRRLKFQQNSSHAINVVPILTLSLPSESSFPDLPHRKRIGVNGSSTFPHMSLEVSASSSTCLYWPFMTDCNERGTWCII